MLQVMSRIILKEAAPTSVGHTEIGAGVAGTSSYCVMVPVALISATKAFVVSF